MFMLEDTCEPQCVHVVQEERDSQKHAITCTSEPTEATDP